MSESVHLHELFQVSERFRRSVNIAADYDDARALEGYVITPLSKAVLSQISIGLMEGSTNRAWSVAGPYGTGKSACMLLIAQVLAYPMKRTSRELVQRKDPELYAQLVRDMPGWEGRGTCGGFVVVPMVGSRQPLALTLLSGLLERLESLPASAPMIDEQAAEIRKLRDAARREELVPPSEVVEAVEATARVMQEANPSVLGLILVLDELGKSLEYAANNVELGDIGLLQNLAEMASRSEKPRVGLVTVLHQAFEHYAAALSLAQQREWQKVQGRFKDIGFLQSPGELLNLIHEAIRPAHETPGLQGVITAEAEQASGLNLLPSDLNPQDGKHVLAGCAPLHPTVTLVLGALFRSRLAQNERSLFAFLSSAEPHGFQEFLHREKWSNNGYRPFYRLDELYDYAVSALGSGLYVNGQGKRWAEIDDALQRLPEDATKLDARVIKSIGMLGLLGDGQHLRASLDVLSFALADNDVTGQDVQAAVERLVRSKIAIYRRYQDAYGLWAGSDVDLDERFRQGMAHVDRSQSLVSLLRRRGELKSYVAKRHLHKTGNFRFFVPWVIDLKSLEETRKRDLEKADGAVVFVIPSAESKPEESMERVVAFSRSLPETRRAQMFFALPQDMRGVREAFDEVLAWEWVAKNTPALEGDRAARQELTGYQMAARARLEKKIAGLFDPAASYKACAWVWKGQVREYASARNLTTAISAACVEVYSEAPIVKNELINRRNISSAASGARRKLIECMLDHGHEERLGIEGYPPEVSIYLSVLEASGLHRQREEGWGFGPPKDDDPYRVLPLWNRIDQFLESTEKGKRPVPDLYNELAAPPFGIKEGLLPIYLTAAVLYWKTETAMYEEGSFVPEPGIAEFERLLRVPERFTLQRYRITPLRTQILEGYPKLFTSTIRPGEVSVLDVVRTLVAFVLRLPRYTQVTGKLSEEAKAVRQVLATAREPQPLLFKYLPEALRFDELDTRSDQLGKYFEQLRRTLLELAQAYDRLLGQIEEELLRALHLSAPIQTARQTIREQVSVLEDSAYDLKLRGFIQRLSDDRLEDTKWLESVASVVVSKPPASWNDADEKRYRVTVTDLAGELRRIESLTLAKGQQPTADRMVRLGVMDGTGSEHYDVLHIRPEQEPEIERGVAVLEDALKSLGLEQNLRLTVLAELAKRILDSRQSEAGHRD